jgi:hypothetical protein
MIHHRLVSAGRDCLVKHIAFWQQRARKARRARKTGEKAGVIVEVDRGRKRGREVKRLLAPPSLLT